VDKKLADKLEQLPKTPGVYFHKNAAGEVIYIGKAANLRARVRQYFQTSRYRDPKTEVLIREIADVDWRELETEADALFLEAELVRRNQPRYNIMLRDDKSLQFIRIDYKSDYPTVTLVRRPLDDGAEYFGPYISGPAIKKSLRYLRRAFPYAISKSSGSSRANLYYHLGLDPGLEENKTSLAAYRANLRKLMQYLRGERVALIREIERDMKKAAKAHDFEQAARLRNQLFALRELSRQVLFGDKELMESALDEALTGLARLLDLRESADDEVLIEARPLRRLRRIEGFDISHMQGTDNVASMVVFSNGVPDKAAYRKFKMRLAGNDDFAHMAEVIRRRLRDENRKKWGEADLMLIDGGKGQLTAALAARDGCGLSYLPMVGLAKQKEEIIIHKKLSLPGADLSRVAVAAKATSAYVVDGAEFLSLALPSDHPIVKLLQRIRDESHRFAVSYHSTLKRGRVSLSLLDELPGVGPVTRKKLLKHFGSVRGLMAAEPAEIQKVLGQKKGALLAHQISSFRADA
jgi:excinuclease ABC subunit C